MNLPNQDQSSHKTFFIVIISVLVIFGIIAGVNLNYSSTQPLPKQLNLTKTVSNQIDLKDDYFNTVKVTPKQNTPTAKAYLVGNLKTGEVYLSLNTSEILPVASVSKLMTAIVATDKFTSTTTINITKDDADTPPVDNKPIVTFIIFCAVILFVTVF